VSIVIVVINGVEIFHNYLRQKVQRWPLRARNCLPWAVYISVAQWNNIHRPFTGGASCYVVIVLSLRLPVWYGILGFNVPLDTV